MRKYGFWFLAIRTLKLMLYYVVLRFDHVNINYEGKRFDVELADTKIKTQLGLSFRRFLPAGHGLVLVYKEYVPHVIWMLNVSISIDIIWLDDKGKIVYTVNSAPPGKSLSDFPIYKPKQKSKYVVELPSGTLKQFEIKVGQYMRIGSVIANTKNR